MPAWLDVTLRQSVIAGLPLGAGFRFTACLLETSARDDFCDLLGAQIMVEFREHPDTAI